MWWKRPTIPRLNSEKKGFRVVHVRVVALGADQIEAVPAVVGVVDRVARLGQALADELGHPLVVFYQEDLHGVGTLGVGPQPGGGYPSGGVGARLSAAFRGS